MATTNRARLILTTPWALATPMEEGMNGSFDRLDAILATRA